MHDSMKGGSGSSRMVKTFQAYLPDCHRTYSCVHCRAHLANHDELISKVRERDQQNDNKKKEKIIKQTQFK